MGRSELSPEQSHFVPRDLHSSSAFSMGLQAGRLNVAGSVERYYDGGELMNIFEDGYPMAAHSHFRAEDASCRDMRMPLGI